MKQTAKTFEIREILPKIFVLTFDRKYELCMTFVRIQEFYESPVFRNRYFDLETFIDYWSAKFGNGSFTYPSVWNGFNLPGKIIEKWVSVVSEHRDLRQREAILLKDIEQECEERGYDLSDIYVIGVHKEQSEERIADVINHEVAHALYTLYPKYKRSCNKLLRGLPDIIATKAQGKLKVMGYGKNVFRDEMQAYFSTETMNESDAFSAALAGRQEFSDNLASFKETLRPDPS